MRPNESNTVAYKWYKARSTFIGHTCHKSDTALSTLPNKILPPEQSHPEPNMLIPILSGLFSKRSSSLSLSRRKGGGGGGRGGAHPAESGPGSSSGGKSNSHPTGVSIPLSGSGKSATTYGSGGGKPKRIPQGSPFSGQYAGGGTRGEVFGSP